MNCDQVRDLLLEGRTPDPAELEKHTRACEACRELMSAERVIATLRADSPLADLSSLGAQVRHDIEQETGLVARLKSLSTPRRWLLALTLALAVWLLEGTLLARADLHLVPLELLLPILFALTALFATAAWSSLRPLYRAALPPSVEVTLITACLVAPVVLTFLQPETGHPAALKGRGSELLPYVGLCFSHGLTLAGLIWLVVRALDRRALKAGVAPWLAGAAGVSVATLALQLHCPIPTTTHWLLAHASIGVVLLAVLFVWRGARAGGLAGDR